MKGNPTIIFHVGQAGWVMDKWWMGDRWKGLCHWSYKYAPLPLMPVWMVIIIQHCKQCSSIKSWWALKECFREKAHTWVFDAVNGARLLLPQFKILCRPLDKELGIDRQWRSIDNLSSGRILDTSVRLCCGVEWFGIPCSNL